MKKGIASQLLPALAVPLILIIFAAVFTNLSSTTIYSFEEAVTNETVGADAGTYTTAYDAKDASVTAAYNGSSTCTIGELCNITYAPFSKATIVSSVDGAIKVSYTKYDQGGYESYEKVRTGTWGGFKLASLLPYIIIAMIVLGILLGAFVMKGL